MDSTRTLSAVSKGRALITDIVVSGGSYQRKLSNIVVVERFASVEDKLLCQTIIYYEKCSHRKCSVNKLNVHSPKTLLNNNF